MDRETGLLEGREEGKVPRKKGKVVRGRVNEYKERVLRDGEAWHVCAGI